MAVAKSTTPRKRKPAKTKILKGLINGGQWTFTGVFELKDGTVIESTRFEALYGEANFANEVKATNVGTLLRWRTREILKKADL